MRTSMRLSSILSFLLLPVLGGFPFSNGADLIPTGVGNFHQVNDHVYRGAQPSPAGLRNLAKLGVRTIIDLREGAEHAREEKKVVEAAGMHYVHVPMAGLGEPKDEQIGTLLSLLDDSSAWPVFVHCKRGADRTGTVIACYRIAHDHWENEKALTEARLHGMSWIERAMQQYIIRFEAGKRSAQSNSPLKPAVATP